jgi:hypothetical protein
MRNRIGKIGALVVLGMFVAMLYLPTALAADVSDNDDYIIDIDADGGGTHYLGVTREAESEELFRVQENGRVGIGTTSPDGLLDIEKSGTVRSNLDILHITNTANAASMTDTRTSIFFNQYYDGAPDGVAEAGRISVGTEDDWDTNTNSRDSFMAFHTALDGTVSEKVRICSNGNVGIGVTDPAEKLEIDGDVIFNTGADREIYVESPQSGPGYDLKIRAGNAINLASGGYAGGDLILKGGNGAGVYGTPSPGGDVYIFGGPYGMSEYPNGDVILAHTGSVARGHVGIGTTSPSIYADLTLEGGVLCLKETTTPTKDTDYGKIYTKNDNKLYFQDGAGTEHEIDFV